MIPFAHTQAWRNSHGDILDDHRKKYLDFLLEGKSDKSFDAPLVFNIPEKPPDPRESLMPAADSAPTVPQKSFEIRSHRLIRDKSDPSKDHYVFNCVSKYVFDNYSCVSFLVARLFR